MRRQVLKLSMVVLNTATVACAAPQRGALPVAASAQPSSGAVADSARRLDSLAMALDVWERPTAEKQRVAVQLWSRAATLYNGVGDRRREADMLTQAGRGHSNRDTAVVYLQTALRIARETADTAAEGRALLWLGVTRIRVSDLDSALTLTREAARIARQVGERWGESRGWAFYWVGRSYLQVAKHDSAEAYFREAIRAARATGARSIEASSLGDIGNIYTSRGSYDSALVYNTAALEGVRAVGNRRAEAIRLMNVGVVHIELGRLDSARVYYQKSLTVTREVGNRSLEQILLVNIGFGFTLAARPDSAAEYFRQAVRLGQELDDKVAAENARANLAEAQNGMGQADSALANARTAVTGLRALKARREEAAALAILVAIHSSARRVDSAIATSREALRVAREAEQGLVESTTLRSLGDLHSRGERRDLATAVAYYDSAAVVMTAMTLAAGADQARVSFAETGGELYDRWVLAWLARTDELGQERSALAALAVAERGRAQALLDLLRRGHRSDSAGASANQPEHRAGADLVQEGRDAAAAVRAVGVPVVAYHATKDTLLTWLILASGEVSVERQAMARDSVTQVVAMIREHLGADEALGRSLRALETGEVPPDVVSPARSSGPTRGGALGYSAAAFGASAATLVPSSLMRRLPAGGELVIVPHGPLGLVAFAALPVRTASTGAASGEPLGARFAIRYAPSLTTLRVVTERAGATATLGRDRASLTRNALVVGNPAMPKVTGGRGGTVRLPALPAAGREGQWVAKALGVTVLTGPAATERAVRARMGNAAVVHLATHGFAYSSDAKALDSFVAFASDSASDGAANGLLTVGEVIDDLPRLTAELVVLSACQTGLGNLRQAEGTVGLQRAFLAKGAQSVLVSLWSVSDDATELLMRRFYTHWLRDADAPSKAEALRRAQVDVRRTPGFADPRFWAAFQLVGAR